MIMKRGFHSGSAMMKGVDKFVVRNSTKPMKELRGSPTIYNSTNSSSNSKGYLKAQRLLEPGLYLNRAQSSPMGSTNIETIPLGFIPKDDPRREYIRHLKYQEKDKQLSKLAPPVLVSKSTVEGKKYHLQPEDISEIKRLRLEDPVKNNRKALAEKFGVSPLFISIVSEPPKSHKEEMKSRLETIKSKWHAKRAIARSDRQKRQELWYRA
ncbi:Mitochondrial ribosomal protein subunit L20 [Nakaseomyces glabratus]|nr:Mitochondrial ribosomal protein subunit L20 [Nakaseomyces glabratus]KAH7593178.1 Mitochondrial ribosomal protein subunit L20 [Nakaseomyces glabratus]